MSLYIQVCIPVDQSELSLLRKSVSCLAQRCSVEVELDSDYGEFWYLSKLLGQEVENTLPFWITSSCEDLDAGSIWQEAKNRAVQIFGTNVKRAEWNTNDSRFSETYFEAVRKSSLGSFIWCLLEIQTKGGIWIADGGPDELVGYLLNDQCRREILRTMVLSWDDLPNMTYIWSTG